MFVIFINVLSSVCCHACSKSIPSEVERDITGQQHQEVERARAQSGPPQAPPGPGHAAAVLGRPGQVRLIKPRLSVHHL